MRIFGLTLLVILMVTTGASGAGISVSQALDKTDMAYEDSATFEITLQWPGPQYAYRFDRPLDPDFDRLKVTGFSSAISSTGTGADEVTYKHYVYTLVPTLSGPARIEPVTITYLAYPDSIPGELVTEPMTIQIADPVPVEAAGEGMPVWAWLLIGIGVMSAGTVAVLARRKRAELPVAPVMTLAETALEQLSVLKKEAGSDFKKFQTGLYALLGDFARDRWGFDIEALDEDALPAALADTDLTDEARAKLTGWLIAARKDKFRPVTAAPGEAIRLESEVRELFEKI